MKLLRKLISEPLLDMLVHNMHMSLYILYIAAYIIYSFFLYSCEKSEPLLISICYSLTIWKRFNCCIEIYLLY